MKEFKAFIDRLANYHAENVINPWHDADVSEIDIANAAAIRRGLLAEYFASRRKADTVFIAEAAGYQGCRFTGIPLTCERMLLNKHRQVGAKEVFPAVIPPFIGRTSRVTEDMNAARATGGYIEPTDTVVWGTALDAGLAPTDFYLWNIFPFHPHKEGNLLSNRTPTDEELAIGLSYARRLFDLIPPKKIFAVGRKSAETLARAGIAAIPLRHPANGGVGEFRRGFAAAMTIT